MPEAPVSVLVSCRTLRPASSVRCGICDEFIWRTRTHRLPSFIAPCEHCFHADCLKEFINGKIQDEYFLTDGCCIMCPCNDQTVPGWCTRELGRCEIKAALGESYGFYEGLAGPETSEGEGEGDGDGDGDGDGGGGGADAEAVAMIVGMGFDEEKARVVLEAADGDLERAVTMLM